MLFEENEADDFVRNCLMHWYIYCC